MTDKYKPQKEYIERNKEKIATNSKRRYLKKHMKEILEPPIIKKYTDQAILDEVDDWYLKLDSSKIRGYRVTVKYKTMLYLLMAYKYRIPIFFHELEIKYPIKRIQLLKEKLIREYSRIYKNDLKVIHLKPFEYIPRLVDKFNLNEQQEKQITKLITITRRKFEFTNPKTYIGSVIYYIMQGILTQNEIATFLDITPNGIRGIYVKLQNYIQKLKLKQQESVQNNDT